jgi:hypothetical protein
LFPDRHHDHHKDGAGNGGDEMNKQRHYQQQQHQYPPDGMAPKHIWVDRLIYHRDDVECYCTISSKTHHCVNTRQ